MSTASILPNGKNSFIDINGNPLVGGTVTFYEPGTLVLKDTWQDADQSILNTNPIILDSRGQAVIYGYGIYRQRVKDSLGNLIWDEETAAPYSPSNPPPGSTTIVMECTIDGAGSTPSTGICGDLYVPFSCVITKAVLQATTAGDIEMDVWAAPFVDDTPPTISDSIVASDPPTLSSSQGSLDATLTGWTTDIAAGTWLRFNINSALTLTRATLSLVATQT